MLETFTSPSLGNAANLVLERSADEKKPTNVKISDLLREEKRLLYRKYC
jgi:hypothetical protein